MTTTTTLIIGASRGIGLELAKQAAAVPGATIIATVRDVTKVDELKAISNVKIITLDQAKAESIAQLDAQLAEAAPDGIDTVIFNAGIYESFYTVLETTRESWEKHFNTNVVGPLELTKVVYPYLKKRDTKRLVYVSSIVGSIGGYLPFSTSSYGLSKAALNYGTVELAFELKDEGFTVLSVHPGVVTTDNAKGKLEAVGAEFTEQILKDSITPEESARGILATLGKITKEDTGKFVDWNGETLPW